MPMITKDFIVKMSNDPATPVLNAQIDLALELSKFYGKEIRQGNNFTIVGAGATIRPSDGSSAIDYGVSATSFLGFIPATKHSRRAWNNAFKMWRAQKNLRGGVGQQIRYDDMEFAYHLDHQNSRTSTVYMQGLPDSDSEYLVLTGGSTETVVSPSIIPGDFSLADFYNSSYPKAAASRQHWDTTVIKAPKADDLFPAEQHFCLTATNSNNATDGLILGDKLTAAVAMDDLDTFPLPHDVLCGLLNITTYVMPDDTINQLEEEFLLTITIYVKKWKALVYPKTRAPKRMTSRNARSYSKKRYSRRRKR